MHTFNILKKFWNDYESDQISIFLILICFQKFKSTNKICCFILSISEKKVHYWHLKSEASTRVQYGPNFQVPSNLFFFQEMDFSYKKMERERFWRENYRRVESQLGNSRAVSLWNTPCVSFHKSTKIFLKQNTGCLTKPFEFWVKLFYLNTL